MDKNIKPNTTNFISDALNLISIQIQKGKDYIKNRPIQKELFENWENTTIKILEKTAVFDPTVIERFMLCGKYGVFEKSNTAFLENRRAMAIYDKLNILEYHINILNKERYTSPGTSARNKTKNDPNPLWA